MMFLFCFYYEHYTFVQPLNSKTTGFLFSFRVKMGKMASAYVLAAVLNIEVLLLVYDLISTMTSSFSFVSSCPTTVTSSRDHTFVEQIFLYFTCNYCGKTQVLHLHVNIYSDSGVVLPCHLLLIHAHFCCH